MYNREIIPCFGLTGPASGSYFYDTFSILFGSYIYLYVIFFFFFSFSGSDAASMRDTGVVVEEKGQLWIRTTFKKRYITLAPIAGVVGLAFNLKDPNNVCTLFCLLCLPILI